MADGFATVAGMAWRPRRHAAGARRVAFEPNLVHTTLTRDFAATFARRFSMVDETAAELFPLVYQFLIQQVQMWSVRGLIQ